MTADGNSSRQQLAIVIVNYRTADLVVGCIESLMVQELDADCHVYIVDNDSGDGSLEKIREHVEGAGLEWISVLAAGKNGGFAYGNNVALRLIQQSVDSDSELPDFYWFLNPDTAVRKHSCQVLMDYLNEHKVHIVGSRLEDEDETPQVSHFNLPSIGNEFVGGISVGVLERLSPKLRTRRDTIDVPEPCDWVSGSSMMVTREVIENVGLMDEDYFLYFEETDYCLKASRAGYTCWHVPDSRVVHYVGGATGVSDSRKKSPRRPKYWFDSRRRFFLKNYGVWKLIGADLGYVIGYALFLLRKKLTGVDLSMEPPHLLSDLIRHSFLMRGFSLDG